MHTYQTQGVGMIPAVCSLMLETIPVLPKEKFSSRSFKTAVRVVFPDPLLPVVA